MVTGEKPDEVVDWGVVNEALDAWAASFAGHVDGLRVALDRLSVSVWGFSMSDAPAWYRELSQLEAEHTVSGLRGRRRRRLASLRARARRALRLAGRANQRAEIGLGGGRDGEKA